MKNTPETFWKRVQIGQPNECWLWVGYCDDFGYGKLSYQGLETSAHRIAYVLKNGVIPIGKIVRHTCDTPTCCNPGHLLLGEPKDNIRDMTLRGRGGNMKLTWEQVRDIRKEYATGNSSQRILAQKYNISRGAITGILRLHSWKEEDNVVEPNQQEDYMLWLGVPVR